MNEKNTTNINNENVRFYKKWWFILITVLVLIGVILSIVLPLTLGKSNTWHIPKPYDENASYTAKSEQGHVEYYNEQFLYHNDETIYPENEKDYALEIFNKLAFTPFLADIFWSFQSYRGDSNNAYYFIDDMLKYQGNGSNISFDYEFYLYLEDENGNKLENKEEIAKAEQISIFFNFKNINIRHMWYLSQEFSQENLYAKNFDIFADYFVVELDYYISDNILIYDYSASNFTYEESTAYGRYFSDVNDNFDSWTLVYDFDINEFIIYGIHMFIFKEDKGYYGEEFKSRNFANMYGFNSSEFEDNTVMFDTENYDDYWYSEGLYGEEYVDFAENGEPGWVEDFTKFAPKEEWIWLFDLNDDYVHFIK